MSGCYFHPWYHALVKPKEIIGIHSSITGSSAKHGLHAASRKMVAIVFPVATTLLGIITLILAFLYSIFDII